VNSERFALVKGLLLRVGRLPEEERAAFLERECPQDPELRREVESLLAHERDEPAILERGILAPDDPEEDNQASKLVGRVISHYRIEALLGQGGM